HADDRDGGDVGGRFGDPRERRLARVEERALVEQVVARVRRKPELGERDDDGAALRRLAQHLDRLARVERRVGDAHPRHRDGDAREAVAIRVEEVERLRVHGRSPRQPSWHEPKDRVWACPASANRRSAATRRRRCCSLGSYVLRPTIRAECSTAASISRTFASGVRNAECADSVTLASVVSTWPAGNGSTAKTSSAAWPS